jgi:hypothetical protein
LEISSARLEKASNTKGGIIIATFNNVLDSFGKNVALAVVLSGILLLIIFLIMEYVRSNKPFQDRDNDA